jgi:hypothetical protein
MQLKQYRLLVTARLLYMFQTLSASIIRSTKNCISTQWCVSWVGMIYNLRGCPRSVATALCHSLFSTPDDGRRKRPKHVVTSKHTAEVASCWSFI